MNESKVDKKLFIVIITLLLLGIAFSYSSSVFIAERLTGDDFFYIKNHLTGIAVGLFFMVFALLIDINIIFQKKIIVTALFFCLVSLAAVFIPGIGHRVAGARRWIEIGFIQFQPSEIVKVFIILYLSYILSLKGERLYDFKKGVLPPLILSMLLVLLVALEPDLSTAVIILGLAITVFFLAGIPFAHLIFIATLPIPFIVYMFETHALLFKRLFFINPYQQPNESGYHLIQSLVSFVKGGVFGRGPGGSLQKYFRLPDAHTNFVFAVIGEELGLVGAGIILILFFFLTFRGIIIASRQPVFRNYLLASSITVLITLQALIHIMVNLGLVPTTGVPMPFLSYGRSSMVVNLFLCGLLLNLSRQQEQ